DFGTKIEKTIILQTWRNFNHFYYETREKLTEICFNCNINESKEDSESKIMTEMSLHILWNILKYPQNVKYQQISDKNLHNNLKSKCHKLGGNADQIFSNLKNRLQKIGFEKRNDNWYYPNSDIKLLWLWKCYQILINQQIMYYTKENIIFQERYINKEKDKLKIELLQIGNPNKSSLEFNVYIQYYNKINKTHAKWAYGYMLTYKEPLNPYSMTLKQGIQHFKDKLQKIERFIHGKDKLIYFKCEFDKCGPPIVSNMNNNDILLHDIYKHLLHYPMIQVYWKIDYRSMVPYKRTIGIEGANLPKRVPEIIVPSNKKFAFNPFLYERDFHKLKTIQDTLHFKVTLNNELQKLLHEVIKNGYLNDLITCQHTNKKQEEKRLYKKIKRKIHYNENNPN
ncbi:hypothetical protein RFI_27497, partial [Reticulomyxa filosa]